MCKQAVIFSVPGSAVVVTAKALLESSLPKEYHLGGRMGEAYAVLLNGDNRCVGVIKLIGGRVEFSLDPDDNYGRWFQRKVMEKFPNCNESRVLWGSFYKWYGMWDLVATGEDKQTVLNALTTAQIEGGAWVCSFHAGDFEGEMVSTIESHKVLDGWQICSLDEGPMTITLTNLESGFEYLRGLEK